MSFDILDTDNDGVLARMRSVSHRRNSDILGTDTSSYLARNKPSGVRGGMGFRPWRSMRQGGDWRDDEKMATSPNASSWPHGKVGLVRRKCRASSLSMCWIMTETQTQPRRVKNPASMLFEGDKHGFIARSKFGAASIAPFPPPARPGLRR